MNERLLLLTCTLLLGVSCALWAPVAAAQEAVVPDTPREDFSTYTDHEDYKVGWTIKDSLPPLASARGEKIDRIISIIHWFMGALFVGWGIFFVYCLVKFRARPGAKASCELPKAKISKYAEVGVLAIEAFLLVGLSMPIWAEVKNKVPNEEDALVIRCVAQQFAWNFHYPGEDGIFGRTSSEFISAVNPLGRDFEDPNGTDDIVTINDMHMPKDRPVLVRLSSLDVVHSFWLPVLRVKQDAVPGMTIPVWFDANRTGKSQVACAQLCGNNHYSMIGRLTIHDEDGYQQWLDDSAPAEFDPDEFEMD